MKSAIEESIETLLSNIRAGFRTHDRGVVFGLLLSCVPFLPVTLLGLFITGWNYLLLRQGRLGDSERKLIIAAFYVGAGNTVVGTALLLWITSAASDLIPSFIYDLGRALRRTAEFIGDLLRDLTHGTHRGDNV